MKKIEAVVRHFKLDEVKAALVDAGICGMTISEVRGFGRQRGHSETYRGTDFAVDFVPKSKIEVIVNDSQADMAVDAILRAAQTGSIGDGKIFITDIAEVVRIRTQESGVMAV